MDRALAASGLLVVADRHDAGARSAVSGLRAGRQLRRALAQDERRQRGTATPSKIGVYGSSSGGHVAELLAMRPRDPRYNAIPLADAPNVDATVAYVAMRSPISNPFARYENAERAASASHDEEPQDVLRPVGDDPRKQPAGNSRAPRDGRRWCRSSSCRARSTTTCCRRCRRSSSRPTRPPAATCSIHLFEGCEHEWVAKPGPQTDKAREMVKAFIARQLNR